MVNKSRLAFGFALLAILFFGFASAQVGDIIIDLDLVAGNESGCSDTPGWIQLSNFTDGNGTEIKYCASIGAFVAENSYVKDADLVQNSGGELACPGGVDVRAFFKDVNQADVLLCIDRGLTSPGELVIANASISEDCPEGNFISTSSDIVLNAEGGSVKHCIGRALAGGGVLPGVGESCTCNTEMTLGGEFSCDNGYRSFCADDEICYGRSTDGGLPCVRADDCDDIDGLNFTGKSYAVSGENGGTITWDDCSPDGTTVLEASCLDDEIEIREQVCDNSCVEGACSEVTFVEECVISNPRWRGLDNIEITPGQTVFGWQGSGDPPGDIVYLSATMSEACDVSRYSFAVYEKDWGKINDDFVREIDVRDSYRGSRMSARLMPPYLGDGFFIFGKDPEFYFTMLRDGKPMIEAEVEGVTDWRALLLKVVKPVCSQARPSACASQDVCFDALQRNGWSDPDGNGVSECISEGDGCNAGNPENCVTEGTCVYRTRISGEIVNEWADDGSGVMSCLVIDRCKDDNLDKCTEEECPNFGGIWDMDNDECREPVEEDPCVLSGAEWWNTDLDRIPSGNRMNKSETAIMAVRGSDECVGKEVEFKLFHNIIGDDPEIYSETATVSKEGSQNYAVSFWTTEFHEEPQLGNDYAKYFFIAKMGGEINATSGNLQVNNRTTGEGDGKGGGESGGSS